MGCYWIVDLGLLMIREGKDLWSLIDCNLLEIDHFQQRWWKRSCTVLHFRYTHKYIRCFVVPVNNVVIVKPLYVEWLYSHNIVHKDLEASNVLVKEAHSWYYCLVADFECLIGVMGMGFFRALEILQACKNRIVREREDLFTNKVVHSYKMTCDKILTRKLPFVNHSLSEDCALLIDFVTNGL